VNVAGGMGRAPPVKREARPATYYRALYLYVQHFTGSTCPTDSSAHTAQAMMQTLQLCNQGLQNFDAASDPNPTQYILVSKPTKNVHNTRLTTVQPHVSATQASVQPHVSAHNNCKTPTPLFGLICT
jgi:hypothetical protein